MTGLASAIGLGFKNTCADVVGWQTLRPQNICVRSFHIWAEISKGILSAAGISKLAFMTISQFYDEQLVEVFRDKGLMLPPAQRAIAEKTSAAI